MESIDKKVDRIRSDVASITELYDYAEKLYPYSNIKEPRKVLIIFSNYKITFYRSMNMKRDVTELL